MNILFDINHPAHVHLFRHAIGLLNSQGHQVTVTSRDKDITLELLDHYKIPHIKLSKAKKGLLGLGFELIWRQCRLLPLLIKRKIQMCVSVTGACSVHICKILNIPTLVFYDTEHAKLQNSLSIPFATRFITPDGFRGRLGKNHITYAGFHDLAYLHPNRFTPNKEVLNLLKISPNEKFIILRFVSWQAAHDVGQQGLSLELKRAIIKTCVQYAKVFIASESSLTDEFESYRFPIPPEYMHDALFYAQMYIGEGGSMATEAAVLGIPSIFISSLTAGVFEEYERKYDLMYSFHPEKQQQILERIESLLQTQDVKQAWEQKRQALLKEKVDVTEWMVQKILEYGKDGKK